MEMEEQQKIAADAQAYKKEGALRKSIETLLGELLLHFYSPFPREIALS